MQPDATKLPSVITVMAHEGRSLASVQILCDSVPQGRTASLSSVFLALQHSLTPPAPLHSLPTRTTRTTVVPLAHVLWIKECLPMLPQHCLPGVNHGMTLFIIADIQSKLPSQVNICAVCLGSGRTQQHLAINKKRRMSLMAVGDRCLTLTHTYTVTQAPQEHQYGARRHLTLLHHCLWL